MPLNPCLTCGACCAFFRASFYWGEADDSTPGGVPAGLTDKLTPHLLVMKGTNQPKPRCIALEGEIGGHVYCRIYEQRSSVCRDFEPSWEKSEPNPRCDKARLMWGLAPISPESWFDVPEVQIAAGIIEEADHCDRNIEPAHKLDEPRQDWMVDGIQNKIEGIGTVVNQEQEPLPA